MTATFWILSVAAGSISISHTRITPESLSTRNGRNLHIKLCIMWSVFADVDCHKRGTTSRSVLGIRYRQIVTLKRTYIITATFWIFFRRCWIILHFTYSNNHLVYYYSYTVMLSDLNRLVHKDILHSQTLSGSSTRSSSTTAEPNNCSEHGKIQEGSKQCTVGTVSISCLLCTKIHNAACDHLQKNLFFTCSLY